MKMNKWLAATVVASVGLAGLAVVLTWGPHDARQMVRDFGVWAALPLGTFLTAFLTNAAKRALGDDDGDGKINALDDTPRGSDPPSAGGTALLVLVLVLSAVTQGCGPGAIGVQADFVAVGGITAARADEVITAARARDLEAVLTEAATECGEAGCSEERSEYYRAEYRRRELAWKPILDCRGPVVEVLRDWVTGLETARLVASESIGVELLVRMKDRFVATYAAMGVCLDAAPTDIELPDLGGLLTAGGES